MIMLIDMWVICVIRLCNPSYHNVGANLCNAHILFYGDTTLSMVSRSLFYARFEVVRLLGNSLSRRLTILILFCPGFLSHSVNITKNPRVMLELT